MNIGTRLQTIASFVPKNSSLADVGTDHAYLPVWLLKEGVITNAIACDIAEGPCKAAENTVAAYGYKNKIEVRIGNGLECIKPGEVNSLAIAGMGGSTIIDILSRNPEVSNSFSTIVLQPMAASNSLRQWLNKNGFEFLDEGLVEEGNILYEILVVRKADYPTTTLTNIELEVGPCLLKNQNSLFEKYLQKLCLHYEKLLANMSKSETAKKTDKFVSITKIYQELEKLYYERYGKRYC